MTAPSHASTTYADLRHAEDQALQLFDECVRRGLITGGKTERTLSQEIFAVAREMFGVRRYWHKRIVRAGRNTLLPYAENPPGLTIQEDDILFLDFGPVFGDWEADLGRTYVIGNDPRKHAIARDAERAWDLGAAHFLANPDLTGAELYRYVCELARHLGREFGHVHCGHLVGRFPHEKIEGDDVTRYLRAENETPLRAPGKAGDPLRWILEIHFIDRAVGYGAFHEQMLPDPMPHRS